MGGKLPLIYAVENASHFLKAVIKKYCFNSLLIIIEPYVSISSINYAPQP